jgi:hypothetical protein
MRVQAALQTCRSTSTVFMRAPASCACGSSPASQASSSCIGTPRSPSPYAAARRARVCGARRRTQALSLHVKGIEGSGAWWLEGETKRLK